MLKSMIDDQNYDKSSVARVKNKRPTGLNGHLSIRDFTLTYKGSYLYINNPIIE